MRYLKINDKKLMIPSFFQVYNFGGGAADKSREIVYADMTDDTPALINYYYINNFYPHSFQSKLFDEIDKYKTIGDVYNHVRDELISSGVKYKGSPDVKYNFNKKVFLLDSGAFNILSKHIAVDTNYDIDKLSNAIVSHMKRYYDFADKYKVDMVVGFDLGGKYTEKDDEKSNKKLCKYLKNIDNDKINNLLVRETIKYLKEHKDFYPKVMCTVHGNTLDEYKASIKYIVEQERKSGVNFFGFALGGVASYKQVDKNWYNDVKIPKGAKKGILNQAIVTARACKMVHDIVGDRPIHALGCGGYSNIVLNYAFGATSFDAASPVRRVGDGTGESAKYVFDKRKRSGKEGTFSKYFIGGINFDNTLRKEDCEYIKINEVDDNMKLCGCPVCNIAKNIHNIKKTYSMKEEDEEANYFSRQLMGLHAVWQHRKLCEVLSDCRNIDEFFNKYSNSLFDSLKGVINTI